MTDTNHRSDGAADQSSLNKAWLGMERAEKVPEIVARTILHEIVEQGLEVGDRLPAEAAMVERFGVGRASLREALRILETNGMIRIKPGPRGGPVVTAPSAADYGETTTLYLHRSGATFAELIEARLMIEPVMTRLAAERKSLDLVVRLKEVLAEAWAALGASAEIWSEATEEFHAVIAGASGNRVLDLYAEALVAIERHRFSHIYTDEENRKKVLRVHDRIAEAVIEGDGDRAEDLSRRHLRALQRSLLADHERHMQEAVEWR